MGVPLVYEDDFRVVVTRKCIELDSESKGGMLEGLGSPSGRLESRWRLTRKDGSPGDSRKLTKKFALG